MQVTLASTSKEDQALAYLTAWQGILGLTEKELELTAHIALHYLSLSQQVKEANLIPELLLSTTAKVHIRQQLGMSANNLQNYLASLKAKNVLQPAGDRYTLNPLLIPDTELTFKFPLATN